MLHQHPVSRQQSLCQVSTFSLSSLALLASREDCTTPCLMMLALTEAMTVTSRHKSCLFIPAKGIIKSAGHRSRPGRRKFCISTIPSNKCWDPCSAVSCDADSSCEVTSHRAVCRDPCSPSPCGPFSNCVVRDTKAECRCLPGHLGHPPHCRPECSGDTECPGYLACVR